MTLRWIALYLPQQEQKIIAYVDCKQGLLVFTSSHPPLMNLICLQTNLKEIFAGETLMFVVLDGGIPASSGVIV